MLYMQTVNLQKFHSFHLKMSLVRGLANSREKVYKMKEASNQSVSVADDKKAFCSSMI